MPIAHNKETGETLLLDPSGQWMPAKTASNPQTGETLAFDGSEWVPVGAKPQAQPQTSILESIRQGVKGPGEEAANTFTFGLADKIKDVGTDAATSFVRFITEDVFGKEFKEPEKRLRAKEQRQAFQKSNPKTALVSSFVGAFANPVGQKVGKFIGGGTGLASTTLRAGGGGAVLGGAQALGEAEGKLSQRLLKAAKGAALGGSIGAVIPGGIKAGAAVATGIKNTGLGIGNLIFKTSAQRESTRAARKVAEALKRDGFTAEEALTRVERLGPEAALMDVGDNTRGLAFSVGNIPGKGKPLIKSTIEKRQVGIRDADENIVGGQINRIKDAITKLVPEPFRSTQAKLRAAKGAEKLYKEAYDTNQFMESPILNKLLKRPSMRKALKQVASLGREEGQNISRIDPELTALLKESGDKITSVGVGRGLKLKTFDRIKQILWDLEQDAKGEFGRATAKSRAVNQTRRDLIRELDVIDQQTTGGVYASARLASGDDLANIEAIERGFKFMSKTEFSTVEEMGEAIAKMTPEAAHFFRIGAANALKSLAGSLNPRGDTTKKLFKQIGLEDKIKMAFGDKELFKQYVRALQKEDDLFKAVADVFGNSKTIERGASVKDLGIDPGMAAQGVADIVSGKVVSGAVKLARTAAGKLKPSLESDAIAKILTGRDIRPLQEFLQPPFIGPLQRNLTGQKLLSDLLIRGQAGSTGR